MHITDQKDFCSGVLFVTIGVGCAAGALALYPLGSASDPGAGYFPLGLGVLLAVLGSVVVAGSLGHTRSEQGAIGRMAWRPLLVILGAVIFFGFLLPRLGLLIALPALVIMSSLATSEFRWREVLLNAVVLTALCFGIFVWGLNLTLPH
jgi:hypothetical protein